MHMQRNMHFAWKCNICSHFPLKPQFSKLMVTSVLSQTFQGQEGRELCCWLHSLLPTFLFLEGWVRQEPLGLNAFANVWENCTSEHDPKKMLVSGRHLHDPHCACKELQESAENKAEKESYTFPYFTAAKGKASINLAFIFLVYT